MFIITERIIKNYTPTDIRFRAGGPHPIRLFVFQEEMPYLPPNSSKKTSNLAPTLIIPALAPH